MPFIANSECNSWTCSARALRERGTGEGGRDGNNWGRHGLMSNLRIVRRDDADVLGGHTLLQQHLYL
jgi:hypothetical protein